LTTSTKHDELSVSRAIAPGPGRTLSELQFLFDAERLKESGRGKIG
jgi:hypothetical protein